MQNDHDILSEGLSKLFGLQVSINYANSNLQLTKHYFLI